MTEEISFGDVSVTFKTLKRESGSWAPVGERKPPKGGNRNTLKRNNGLFSTPEGGKFSIHGPRSKMPMCLTPSRGDNKRLAIFNSNKRAGEEDAKHRS